MKSVRFFPVALSSVMASTLLVACSGMQSGGVLAPRAEFSGSIKRQTFTYTGGKQEFRVPLGVQQVTITAFGASGQMGYDHYYGSYASPGGLGARVTATVTVSPISTLFVYVGGAGSDGGYNGGGSGGGYDGEGGGASDVRQGGSALSNRIVVAGGGGGGGSAGACVSTSCGYTAGGAGGNGGGQDGQAGRNAHGRFGGDGGGGGTQRAGGKHGKSVDRHCAGSRGQLGVGGAGGGGRPSCGNLGAGGGGGYYGGGGGGAGGLYGSSPSSFAAAGGGGGGGSSFVESGATGVKMHPGKRTGDGLIIIAW